MSKPSQKPQKISVFVAWPYANAPTLHIGHLVGAILPADIFARYHRLKGNLVLHVTGTDMHGTPVSIKAEKQGQKPEIFAKNNHNNFVQQLKQLRINFNLYTNTHNPLHFKVVNNMGQLLYKKGFLIPKKTKMFYDPKAKRYLPDRYVEGTCPYCGYSPARGDQCDNCGRILDPLELKDPKSKLTGTTPEIREVTNLYLDLPKIEKQLKDWLKTKKNFRKHVLEMTLGFIKEGLKDRPVTRNMEWGIPVEIPGFEDQVWYVWFEAVIGYLSAAIAYFEKEFPDGVEVIYFADEKLQNLSWEDFWKGESLHYYFLGKDNIPFHTIIWPGQIMMYNTKYDDAGLIEEFKLPAEASNAPLNLAYDVPANNFMNMNNAKISKSTGNYIGVADLLEQFEPDAIRYVFSRLMPETKDSNFTMQRFYDLVNNELVATIGNLVYRVLSFTHKNYGGKAPQPSISQKTLTLINRFFANIDKAISNVELAKGIEQILLLAAEGNKIFNQGKPWETKESEEAKQTVTDTLAIIANLGVLIRPYTPTLGENILNQLGLSIETGWKVFTDVNRITIARPKILVKKIEE